MREVRPALAETYLSATTLRLRRSFTSDLDGESLRQLAQQLKDVCIEDWDTGPTRPRLAAKRLIELAGDHPDPQIKAYCDWAQGIRNLTFGRLEQAVSDLGTASRRFARSGNLHESAKPQIALVTALSILGDHIRAERIGRRALKIFEDLKDPIGAGKVEINLSNLASRRGKHQKAEMLAISARSRFVATGSEPLISVAENGLAITYTELYDFVSAERYFSSALSSAHSSGKLVTEAEIEASIGSLKLNRTDLAGSLRAFELSRQKFETLRMPHKSLVADLEIADIYAELNMESEALQLYAKTVPMLAKMQMPIEEARARIGYGNLLARVGQHRAAFRQFEQAQKLFSALGNTNGRAIVNLSQSWLELRQKKYHIAMDIAQKARQTFSRMGNRRQVAMADWIIGEALIKQGKVERGVKVLAGSLSEAKKSGNAQVKFLSYLSLGDAESSRGEVNRSIAFYRKAIETSDSIREPLVSDEFRISVFQGRQEPYERLAQIFLGRGQVAKAFEIIESGRSKELHDLLIRKEPDADDGVFKDRISKMREILNWDYARLRTAESTESKRLRKKIVSQERSLASLLRRSQSTRVRSISAESRIEKDRLSEVQSMLHPNAAILYLFTLKESYSAFLITKNGIDLFKDLAGQTRVRELSLQLRFQIDTFRFGGGALSKWAGLLKSRTDQILNDLGHVFREPLSRLNGVDELIVIPAGEFHYIPFSALRDNGRYLTEKLAIRYSSSAAVWSTLKERPLPLFKRTFFMGFATETVPDVEAEALELSKQFDGSRCLVGKDATLSNFLTIAPGRDLIHIACHGDFRSDEARYSSLFMADGRINVNDIAAARLTAGLVTLSACETGINQVHDGEEIVGLARGFLAAGASSLVLSLWNVNDSATKEFMIKFYKDLRHGSAVIDALRSAQLQFIKYDEHPYYWAPFVAFG